MNPVTNNSFRRHSPYDGVVLVPGYSEVLPENTSHRPLKLTRKNSPAESLGFSARIGTEARVGHFQGWPGGGLGFIHKNIPSKSRLLQVRRLKRRKAGMIFGSHYIGYTMPRKDAEAIIRSQLLAAFPSVVDEALYLKGSSPNRDIEISSRDWNAR